ncbi:hypothetical protein F5141DRAFT_752231 [Pisolithus sp. B1]|nr:hypothetical protein F5141DRAFT_752231 [Pisolithus sp. B1]
MVLTTASRYPKHLASAVTQRAKLKQLTHTRIDATADSPLRPPYGEGVLSLTKQSSIPQSMTILRCEMQAANPRGPGSSSFILEGPVTVVVGAIPFWIIVDFPDDAKCLTEMERTVVIRGLQGDNQFSAAGERLKWKYMKSLTEWKTYVAVFVYGSADMPLYAFFLCFCQVSSGR